MKDKRAVYWIFLVIGVIGLLFFWFWRNPTLREALTIFLNTESLQTWLREKNQWAFIWFLGLQVLQTVIFVIPGEIVQIAGGYVFGGFLAVILSTLGIAVGSTIAYWGGYFLGRRAMEKIVGKKTLNKWTALMQERRSFISILLLFVVPGFPKDILCYISGFGKMGYGVFILLSLIARQPGIIGSSLIGTAASNQNWLVAGGIAVCAVIILVLAHYYREPIMRGLTSRSTVPGKKGEGCNSKTPKG